MDNETIKKEIVNGAEEIESLARQLLDQLGTDVESAQGRAGLVAWALAKGEKLTTNDVAELCGMAPRSARDMLAQLAEVLPIHRVKRYWQEIEGE